ncbi:MULTISPECIES: hypothetical protein [unclassified Moorena]|uniref:hypothetical protein n=1 Tax=unclassified Moorena TaxID=2683338 RepID=UPI0013B7751D|nr:MULTISPECIES: hypothetical protein [unclassified Moorena]NER87294.1 hypothetical protein [Moorena sp. SIO3A2]
MPTLHRTAKGLWPRYTEHFMPIAHAVLIQSASGGNPREATASLLFAQHLK